jgi:hypothetical protein
MTEIRLVGRAAASDRPLYFVRIEDVDDQPTCLPEGVRPFVVFTALDARRASDERLKSFARTWLDFGCAWSCSWGPGSERVEFAFDQAEIAIEPFVTPWFTDSLCVTTSHETESLDDALWFAVFGTSPSYGKYGALFAVVEKEWADEIEARLADSETWSAKLLAEEEKGV